MWKGKNLCRVEYNLNERNSREITLTHTERKREREREESIYITALSYYTTFIYDGDCMGGHYST